MILIKCPLGCQYINTHNAPIGNALNCNINVQVGDDCQCFYCTLYTSKSTQEEDSERQKYINDATIILLIKREKSAILDVDTENPTDNNIFVDGLCAMLRGMNTATARDTISPTMAPILTSLDGTQVWYSDNFVNLLIGQLEATLDGQPVDARIQTNKSKTGEKNFGQTHHLMTIFIGQTTQNICHHTNIPCSTKQSQNRSIRLIQMMRQSTEVTVEIVTMQVVANEAWYVSF